jgi:hypothetical protein
MQFLGRRSIVTEDQERQTESLILVPPLRRGHESMMRLFGAEPMPPFAACWMGQVGALGLWQLSAHPNINTQSEDF